MADRILVTGGAGFVGAHFVRHVLDTTDWEVVVLDRIDAAGSMSRIADAKERHPSRVGFVWHDLRAELHPDKAPELRGPFRYVVHMAAASHVDRSVRDPMSFLLDNVIGTGNLLEFCRHHVDPEKTLVFSTDEVFGPAPPGILFNEDDAHYPNNPYAASKSASETLCPAWANTYGMPIVVTHCTNIFGPGQHHEKFIPLATRKILRGETVQIHCRDGVPSSRCYLHVDNVCTAVMVALERGGVLGGVGTGKYNIAGDAEVSNLYVATRIAELLDRELFYECTDFASGRPRHDQRYAVNAFRLHVLGWAVTTPFESGLAQTVAALAGDPG